MRDPMEILEDALARRPRLWAWYTRWNICKAHLVDGREKPYTRVYGLLHRLFYWDCACCASFRGFFMGLLCGGLAAWSIWG